VLPLWPLPFAFVAIVLPEINEPKLIDAHKWVVAHKRIQIHSGCVADGIGSEPAAEVGLVEASAEPDPAEFVVDAFGGVAPGVVEREFGGEEGGPGKPGGFGGRGGFFAEGAVVVGGGDGVVVGIDEMSDVAEEVVEGDVCFSVQF